MEKSKTKVKQTLNKAKNETKKGGENVKQATKKAADTVKGKTKKAASKVKDAADKATSKVKDGAKKAKSEVKKSANKTKAPAKELKEDVKEKTQEFSKDDNIARDNVKEKANKALFNINEKLNKSSGFSNKHFKSLLMILFISVIIFSGCMKGKNTSLKSSYFKDNHSEKLPKHNYSTITQEDTTKLAKSVLPAVVAIVAKSGLAENIGSGVCVKSGGYILTNQHVIDNAKSIKLYFSNNETASAIVLWQDPVMDIAILKSSSSIPYLEMADNDLSEIGHDVLAVGTPLSLNFTHTITKGIISAVNRTIQVSTKNGEALMQNLIQHDASINPGNSGGPLIDTNGAVIGINTLKISTAEGLGFAIPINSVQTIVENIYNDYNYKTPFIGLFGYDNSLNLAFEDEEVLGFFVKDVKQNSPAHLSGLVEGDVIIEVDDEIVKTATQFRKQLFAKDAREKVKLKVRREGRVFETFIKPVENTNFKPDN